NRLASGFATAQACRTRPPNPSAAYACFVRRWPCDHFRGDRMAITPATSVIKDSILDTIGNTPLVRLSRIGAGLTPQLVAKLETFNPGGSIKDRVAVRLLGAA